MLNADYHTKKFMKKPLTRLFFSISISFAGLAVGMAAPAKALTFTVTTGQPAPGGETNQGAFSEEANVQTIDFNEFADGSAPPATVGIATFTDGTEAIIRNDSSKPNNFAPGLCDSTTGLAPCSFDFGKSNNESSYLSVGSTAGSITVSFSKALDYLGFNYGFSDASNLTAILKNGTTTLREFNESDFFSELGDSSQSHGYINLFAGDDPFDTVIFASVNNAGRFEVDNIAYKEKVPTPALLPGLLGMGAAALRRRKRAAESPEA